MKRGHMTDVQIVEALRAHLPERAQAGLRARIIDAAATTTQARPSLTFRGRAIALRGLDERTGRVRTNRWALVLAAAAILTLVTASAIFIGRQRPALVAINPTPTPASTTSETVTPTTTTTPTATATAEVSPPPVNLSPVLTWTKVVTGGVGPMTAKVAWLGDRFVLLDEDARTVSTSTDGAIWDVLQPGDPDPGYADLLKGSYVSWQDEVVGWWNPEDGPDIAGKPPVTARDVVRISRPPAEPTVATPFKGRIESIGIGPVGIVAQVHSDLDWDAWVTKKLGARSNNAWVTHLKGVDFRDGILQIKLDNGPGLKVVWADQGFLPGDYQDAGFEWYSPDGVQWTAVPIGVPWSNGDSGLGFPTGFGEVIGVSDGFIARGDNPEDTCPIPAGCSEMWYSPDGLSWRNLGKPASDSSYESRLLPWKGGALITDGVGRFDVWTSQGHSVLPIAGKLPPASKQPNPTSATGPLGLVTILNGDKKIIVSRDGVDWDIQQMPAEMVAAASAGRLAPTVAVGDRSALVMVWSGSYEKGYVPSLWRGTLEP